MRIFHIIRVFTRTMRIWVVHKFLNIKIHSKIYDINLNTRIYGKNGYVSLGRRVKTSRNVVLVAVNGFLEVGDGCSFSGNCTVVAHEKIIIGKNCLFGPGVKIYDHDHLFDESGVLPDGYRASQITIGEKTWIGANSIILKGTNIGEGCIIGAGTIVRGNIPPHSIVTNDRELIIRPIKNK